MDMDKSADTDKQLTYTSCGHIFDRECIETWVTVMKKFECPLCHALITPGGVAD